MWDRPRIIGDLQDQNSFGILCGKCGIKMPSAFFVVNEAALCFYGEAG
jgi:hypothetical protein